MAPPAAPPTTEAPAATTTTTTVVSTTTPVAPEAIPTPQPPLVGDGVVAFPAFAEGSETSGSDLGWIVILVGIATGTVGILVGWCLQRQD